MRRALYGCLALAFGLTALLAPLAGPPRAIPVLLWLGCAAMLLSRAAVPRRVAP